MARSVQQKSTFEIWQRWASVLARQLEQVADVYEYHEEGNEAKRVNAFVDNLRLFIDPLAKASKLAKLDYEVSGHVSKLYLLSLTMLNKYFRDALNMLPEISSDMQRLLNSPYQGSCNGRTASDIFKGPHGSVNEGIGSGIPDESGGLPWVLQGLLEEAEFGGEDYLSIGLDMSHAVGHPSEDNDALAPERHGHLIPKKRMARTGGFE